MATQPHARIVLSSSPLGPDDAHARAFAEGDTEFQMTAHAPTWEANPTISEEETHRLEPDPKVWAREYAAIPQAAASAAFDPADVARAIKPLPSGCAVASHTVMLIDSSAGRGDAWTWACAAWFKLGERDILGVWDVDALGGRFAGSTDAGQVMNRLASYAKAHRAAFATGDAYQSFFVTRELAARGVHYVEQKWTSDTKSRAVSQLRAWLRGGTILIEPGTEGERVRRELLAFEERIAPSGFLTFAGRRGGHDDRVALLLNVAMLTLDGRFGPQEPVNAGLENEYDRLTSRAFTGRSTADGGRDFDGEGAFGGDEDDDDPAADYEERGYRIFRPGEAMSAAQAAGVPQGPAVPLRGSWMRGNTT